MSETRGLPSRVEVEDAIHNDACRCGVAAHAGQYGRVALAVLALFEAAVDRIRLADTYHPEGVEIVMAKLHEARARADAAEATVGFVRELATDHWLYDSCEDPHTEGSGIPTGRVLRAADVIRACDGD